MANFLENNPTSYPGYVQQINPDAYLQTGLITQQKYDEGVKNVQGYVNSIAGMQVARPQDQQYLQNRLGELTSKVNSVVGAEWGSQALVNQVGGLAAQIGNDRNVQNATAGTQRLIKIQSDIEEAKKKGDTYAVQNEYKATKEINNWFSNPNAGAELSRNASYTPYVDVNKKINELWKDAHPDSILRQSTNGDYYAYVMTETGLKALPPDQVRSQIEGMLDPNLANQLDINAEYNYRNFNSDNLKTEIDSVYKGREDSYDNYIKKLQLDRLSKANDPNALNEIDLAIGQTNTKLTALQRSKLEISNASIQNPDAVKSYLYRNKWLDSMAGMIGYTEQSQKIVENPIRKQAWDEYMDWNKFQLDQDKFKLDQQKLALDATKASSKSKTGDGDNLGDLGTIAPADLTGNKALTIDQFNDKAISMYSNANDAFLELVWRKNPELYKDPQIVPNSDGTMKTKYVPKDKNTLMQIMAKGAELKTLYEQGAAGLDPMAKTFFDNYLPQLQLSDKMKAVSQKVQANAEKYIKTQSEYSPKFEELDRVKKALGGAAPFTAVTRNGNVNIAGRDLKNYAALIANEKASSPQAGGTAGTPSTPYQAYSDATLGKYNLTREEYNAISTHAPQQYREAIQRIDALTSTLRPSINTKNDYINQQLRPYQDLGLNTEIQINTAKPEQAKQWASVIGTIANQRSGTTLAGDTKWDRINTMLNSKNVGSLTVTYSQPSTGENPILYVSNPNVKGGNRESVELDIPTATSLGLYQDDSLAFAKNMLALNEGRTTGKLKFGNIGKYNIQYEVQPYLNNYTTTLYVTIPGQMSTPKPIVVNEGSLGTLEAVSNFLKNPSLESYLDQKLGIQSANTPASNPFIQSNPFFQQAQAAGITPQNPVNAGR